MCNEIRCLEILRILKRILQLCYRAFAKMESQYLSSANESPQLKTDEFSWLWMCNHTNFDAEQLKDVSITLDDFRAALKLVQPSAQREGFATVPDVTWDDVGALTNVRQELNLAILVTKVNAPSLEVTH